MTAETIAMPPAEDLFIYVYVLTDDAIAARAISVKRSPFRVQRQFTAGHEVRLEY